MAIRVLRLEGDPILRKNSKEVKDFDEKLHTLLDDMRETMHEFMGVGLAAVQVGKLKRAFVVEIEDEYYEFINPEFLEVKGGVIQDEGCLSVPDKVGAVERPEYVVIKAFDRHGEEFTLEADDLLAIAICHEYDHLDGILYIDKVIPEDELEDEM